MILDHEDLWGEGRLVRRGGVALSTKGIQETVMERGQWVRTVTFGNPEDIRDGAGLKSKRRLKPCAKFP